VHREKFDEMGQHFQQEEETKKISAVLKRKNLDKVKTSTPAKRQSLNFNFDDTPNSSQNSIGANDSMSRMLSQASSGYFSQSSTFSDF
jgi:hypothetical protein